MAFLTTEDAKQIEKLGPPTTVKRRRWLIFTTSERRNPALNALTPNAATCTACSGNLFLEISGSDNVDVPFTATSHADLSSKLSHVTGCWVEAFTKTEALALVSKLQALTPQEISPELPEHLLQAGVDWFDERVHQCPDDHLCVFCVF